MNAVQVLPATVLATSAREGLSARYQFVSSHEVVRMMESEGFQVASVTTRGAKKRDPLYAKHQIDFRHPDLGSVDGGVPRIIFTNSHDGSSGVSFMAGVFRFVCSNGLVVGSTYAREVTRHVGESAATLIDRVRRLSKNTAPLFAQIEDWSKKEMSEGEAHEFARLAAVLRFGDAQRFDPAQLLGVQRAEDEGRTLWRVFNRVQENAMRGQLEGATADGRRLVARPLRSLDASTSFNSDLWRLAEEFA